MRSLKQKMGSRKLNILAKMARMKKKKIVSVFITQKQKTKYQITHTKYDNTYYHENGTFPFSFFRITKTRIRKFSVLSLTDRYWRTTPRFQGGCLLATLSPFEVWYDRRQHTTQNSTADWYKKAIVVFIFITVQ